MLAAFGVDRMSNNAIFFTQIASVVVFVFALFGIYRSLVSQKDGVIDLLREQLKHKENQVKELYAQSPDVLAKTLSERIDIATKEIERLRSDGDKHKEEIEKKQEELATSKEQLGTLGSLIEDTDLVCPHCRSAFG